MALLVLEEMGVLEAQRQQLQAVLQSLELSAVWAEMFLKNAKIERYNSVIY